MHSLDRSSEVKVRREVTRPDNDGCRVGIHGQWLILDKIKLVIELVRGPVASDGALLCG